MLVCAALVTAGAGIDEVLRERGRRWFVASASIVGASGSSFRFCARLLGPTSSGSGPSRSSGPRWAISCSRRRASRRDRRGVVPGERSRNQVLLVAFLALGAATFGERSSLVLPVVAVAVTLWRARKPWRRPLRARGRRSAWSCWDGRSCEPVLPGRRRERRRRPGPAARTGHGRRPSRRVAGHPGGRRRSVRSSDGGRAPQVAYLTRATPADIEEATRRWADAHNLFLENAVTSGLLGLIPLVAVFGCWWGGRGGLVRTAPGAWAPPPRSGPSPWWSPSTWS